ncbi:unnamed protein product [Paramecium octaurelia]|uniref:Transmembrane protein n=1 Tax=Paramecium octaurelia TaxID=43137 RepID=A0A8S1YSI9_PAROT|nr:unnamed protein product [Paramecium octaurelia]
MRRNSVGEKSRMKRNYKVAGKETEIKLEIRQNPILSLAERKSNQIQKRSQYLNVSPEKIKVNNIKLNSLEMFINILVFFIVTSPQEDITKLLTYARIFATQNNSFSLFLVLLSILIQFQSLDLYAVFQAQYQNKCQTKKVQVENLNALLH